MNNDDNVSEKMTNEEVKVVDPASINRTPYIIVILMLLALAGAGIGYFIYTGLFDDNKTNNNTSNNTSVNEIENL